MPEEHYGGPSVACSDRCPPMLNVFKLAEPDVVLARYGVGLDKINVCLPCSLPTYGSDVVLGGICISRDRMAGAIAFLDLGLVVLWP